MAILGITLLVLSCNENRTKEKGSSCCEDESRNPVSTETREVKDQSFDALFKEISVKEIPESVFKLVGEDYTIITAGDPGHFNSMVASWGGWGLLFEKPTAWCFLRANRYTLELIRKEQGYTLSYFEEHHKPSLMEFGTQSGRDSNKMKETTLTTVQTPKGLMSYKEAKLIIECQLTQITTVSPDDFISQEGRDFVREGYQEANEYHKLVFGEITGVWVRK